MYELNDKSYQEINDFLVKNIEKREIKPCIPYEYQECDTIYEVIIISADYPYYDRDGKDYKFYYYNLKYSNEDFLHELGVLDCGGYYISVCIFKNRINVTDEYIFNKEKEKAENRFFKLNMKTIIPNQVYN